MDKIKNHFKYNFIIYLILITCIIVFAIIYYMNRHPLDEKLPPIDTKYFYKENLSTTLELFNKSETTFLVIGSDDCSATRSYVEYLNYEFANIKLDVHYLNLKDITEDENVKKLIDKLDYEYTLDGKTDTFGSFLGVTPMTIIIKDKKQVYGRIGSMDDAAIEAIAVLYELA